VDGASWISGTTGTSSFEEIDDLRLMVSSVCLPLTPMRLRQAIL
jgi:hypothetical protein